jgi:hypothetical protein
MVPLIWESQESGSRRVGIRDQARYACPFRVPPIRALRNLGARDSEGATDRARRLLREGNRAPSILSSRLNFGAVAFVLLASIAIVLTLMFPEIQLQPPEL